MILDLHLAIAHHLLAFAIFGTLVAELTLIRANAAAADIRRVRAYIWEELGVFALIPSFAAAMARGYGSMG